MTAATVGQPTARHRLDNTLPVSEVFGPTFQGEGPHTGRAAAFVRLGRCNLSCSWCDTPWTWDTERYDVAAECPDTTVGDIVARVEHTGARLVVLTGGEPLMHQRRLAFTRLLDSLLVPVHVETNGTIPPTDEIAGRVRHFTVSPKLGNNHADPEHRRIRPAALARFTTLARSGRACFKFVVTSPDDLPEVDQLRRDHDIPRNAVWIMPEGTTPDTILARHRDLADPILTYGFNTSTRLHTLIWPHDDRGR